MGLAMTDTPASLGTERLKFAAQQRQQVMSFNNQQGEAPLFTDAIEAEIIELAEQRSDEGKQWFGRVMSPRSCWTGAPVRSKQVFTPWKMCLQPCRQVRRKS